MAVDLDARGLAVAALQAAGQGLTPEKQQEIVNAVLAVVTPMVNAINALIPTQASADNQLADKAFTNSSVQTATANFRGFWSSWSAVPTNSEDYPVDYAGSKKPTVNDYLVVLDASGFPDTEEHKGTWRFKYSGIWESEGKAGWLPEYRVNEEPLTAAQAAALNSGVTAALVALIATATQGVTLNGQSVINPATHVAAITRLPENTITAYEVGSTIPHIIKTYYEEA